MLGTEIWCKTGLLCVSMKLVLWVVCWKSSTASWKNEPSPSVFRHWMMVRATEIYSLHCIDMQWLSCLEAFSNRFSKVLDKCRSVWKQHHRCQCTHISETWLVRKYVNGQVDGGCSKMELKRWCNRDQMQKRTKQIHSSQVKSENTGSMNEKALINIFNGSSRPLDIVLLLVVLHCRA